MPDSMNAYLAFANEAAAALEADVVADADLCDAGMIFGSGFAPFRGGPLQYARSEGVAEIRSRLLALAEQHGDRFTPSSGWQKLGG